ncbi:hypothetical protein CHY08_07180 [Rhizobium leguminosarum bv. viciae]|uniref:hypothetical protein n=1 Tax=Rhizobium leguminosarum TaxID=384 RepID=UPI000B8CAD43|nr:hypothetical protein [Rhizobium leguminosarum]ASR06919.1 hypothetical protein CHY08_07180 [Rhizobium leguminosarum bv. viciae]
MLPDVPQRRDGTGIDDQPEALSELAQAVEAGALGPGDAYKLAYQQKLEAEKPKNNFMSAGGAIYDTQSRQWITPPTGAGGPEYGLNPVYGTDATGKTGIGQVSKDGTFHIVDTGGFQPVGTTSNINLGTTVRTNDKAGNLISSSPIDNAGAASDTKLGASVGEARATYNSMTSKMPGLEMVVKKLDDLSGKATYTAAGQMLDLGRKQLGMNPRDEAIARAEYISTVDNQVLPLLRDTFGAAFTQKEGETLRNTLGDPDKSPQEKQAVLRSFIEQKRRDVEALALQAGQAAPVPTGGSTTSTGVPWSIEP